MHWFQEWMRKAHRDLDYVYDFLGMKMKEGKLQEIDDFLYVVMDVVGGVSTDVLIAILTATLPVKDKCSTRRYLYRKVEEKLGSEILQGLS
jgi:hypothetical protein